jgi:hypothetical protein
VCVCGPAFRPTGLSCVSVSSSAPCPPALTGRVRAESRAVRARYELVRLAQVGLLDRRRTDVAEIVVDVIEVARELARNRLVRMRASQRDLIEERLIGTNEAPVVLVDGAVGHLERLADVEDLALVVLVGVIAVAEAVACERRTEIVGEKELCAGGQLVEGPFQLSRPIWGTAVRRRPDDGERVVGGGAGEDER